MEVGNIKKSARIEWLDILKCIVMYFVVIGHAQRYPATPETYRFLIYSFHMPLFFAISGMGYYLQMQKRNFEFQGLLKNKFKTLIWPYFALSFLAIPIWILNFRIFSDSHRRILELIGGIFYSNEEKISSPTNATWFIVTLFLVIILFFLVEKWSKNNEQALTLMVLVIGSFGYTMSLREDKFWAPWHLETVPIAIVFFLMGYLLIKHFELFERLLGSKKRQLLWVVVLLPIAYCCARYNSKISMSVNNYGSILLLMGSVLGFSVICIIVSINLPKLKLFTFIGRNTIVYLAFHAPMLRFLIVYSNVTNQFIELHPIAAGSVVFVALIPISWIFEKCFPFLMGKPFRKYKLMKSGGVK